MVLLIMDEAKNSVIRFLVVNITPHLSMVSVNGGYILEDLVLGYR